MNDLANRDRVKFFNLSLKKLTDEYNRRRKCNKVLAVAFRMGITFFGLLATVLLGLKGYNLVVWFNGDWLFVSALISSSIVTFLSTLEIYVDPHWLWTIYASAIVELYQIECDFNYCSAANEGVPADQLDGFYARRNKVVQNLKLLWTDKMKHERIKPTQE